MDEVILRRGPGDRFAPVGLGVSATPLPSPHHGPRHPDPRSDKEPGSVLASTSADRQTSGFFVTRLDSGGIAGREGGLKLGDQILQSFSFPSERLVVDDRVKEETSSYTPAHFLLSSSALLLRTSLPPFALLNLRESLVPLGSLSFLSPSMHYVLRSGSWPVSKRFCRQGQIVPLEKGKKEKCDALVHGSAVPLGWILPRRLARGDIERVFEGLIINPNLSSHRQLESVVASPVRKASPPSEERMSGSAPPFGSGLITPRRRRLDVDDGGKRGRESAKKISDSDRVY
ncbi:unnamed protein product [Cyprideis torosa]|uniref:Uncharacterized protein n=1 Tax=Cyprideis torosa TaxID=163714 RepID=A0A7R8W9C1_9CRUS|nr:unnamed protein product [Cyprideis torosa]CAG0884243.1 unnamed protein product [Cyprideis torosa]